MHGEVGFVGWRGGVGDISEKALEARYIDDNIRKLMQASEHQGISPR
jgi:hypothetical protein